MTVKNKILLVEDSNMAEAIIKPVLENTGYEIIVARDGEEGLNIFKERQQEIFVICTSRSMPIMNGIQMAREIKNINKDIPIILYTTDYIKPESTGGLIDSRVDKTESYSDTTLINEIQKYTPKG